MNKKYPDELYLEIANLYRSGIEVKAITERFGHNAELVRRSLKKHEVVLRQTIGKKNQAEIISLYESGLNCYEVAERLGMNNVSVGNCLKRNNIEIRQSANRVYTADWNFFDEIDTEAKAYVLGFFYADGCNYQVENRVQIALVDPDSIELIKREMNSSHPIREVVKEGNRKTQFSLTIHNEKLSQELANRGCMARKTLLLKYPDASIVPENLQHHFVRGYFDGDGCIHNRKNSNNYVVHIIGTEEFVKGMQAVVPVPSFSHQRTGKPVWFMGIYKIKDIVDFGNWLYSDATLFMERKKLLFPT